MWSNKETKAYTCLQRCVHINTRILEHQNHAVDSGHPHCCSTLIAHELSQLNIDIAALSEVRLHEEGSLREHGAIYTLYWSGELRTESHLSGIGFMIKNSLASKLENLPTGHSDIILIILSPYASHYTISNMLFSLVYTPQLSKLTLPKKISSTSTCAALPKRFLQMIRS
ncbi:hypothetical protein BTVI_05653 [Pitangus sulphuratus]|nr:hypothetical protein BTVI_05653 [Pitangus sulphuratus]